MRYWSNSNLNLLYLYLGVTPLGVTPLEFCLHLWNRQTRVPGLSYDIVCMFSHLSKLRLVTHRRTDGHTMTAYTVLAQRCTVINYSAWPALRVYVSLLLLSFHTSMSAVCY